PCPRPAHRAVLQPPLGETGPAAARRADPRDRSRRAGRGVGAAALLRVVPILPSCLFLLRSPSAGLSGFPGRDPSRRSNVPPRLFEYFRQETPSNLGEPDQDSRIIAIMIREEEGFRIELHQDIAIC